jgi:phosphoglycerol transferase MdoB-like AlkP superfamily enzyme
MLSRIYFILRYWLLWILFFEVCRVVFLLANFTETKAAGFQNALGSLFHGLRMDLSMAAYITLPVCIIILFSVFIRFFQKSAVINIYTGIILSFTLFLSIADIGLFKAWGYRIDASPLKYLSNPKEAWASVSNEPIFWILAGFIVAWIALFLLFRKLISKWLFQMQESRSKIVSGIAILFLTAAFIIPLRGGFQLAPINQSSVYFSKNNYSNLSAINACFNFLFSVTHNADIKKNPFIFMPEEDAAKIVSSFADKNTSATDSIPLIKKGIKPNVIIVIWESFTKKATESIRNGIEVTPCFNQLKKEGIYFTNAYATGDRTDKGIVAVLSGYPAQPVTSIVKIPSKASKLPIIPVELNKNGYRSLFYYGGEPEFANMKAYLSGGNFDHFTTISEFSKKDQNSKWGAHDGVVMEKVFEGMNTSSQPFFCNWLTLTSHEPFETPVSTVIAGTDDESLFLNSLHYTDSIVNLLIQKCKKQPWWDNTVMVIVADHGHRLPRTGKKIDDFKIPILFLGGALNQQGVQIPATVSQIDIAATLLGGLGYDHSKFTFSKDALNTANKQYAYMSFYNGFGFVQPHSFFFFDNQGRQIIEQGGKMDSTDMHTGKAFEQMTFQDYINK